MDYCRRRVMVTEWIDGTKLSESPKDQIGEQFSVLQECFLRQLLEVGFFHNDPHPGNLLVMKDQTKGKVAIIDYGLMVSIPEKERK